MSTTTLPSRAEPKHLIAEVSKFVEEFMSHYDGSHDFLHIKRVVGLSHRIYAMSLQAPTKSTDSSINKRTPLESANTSSDDLSITALPLDPLVITLSALLHDVGDKKYLRPGEDHRTIAKNLLLSLGASAGLAEKVQTICLAVSYSSEIEDLQYVQDVITQYPELAIVQDADRLDALGAVGIGRFFTYGGAKLERSMKESISMTERKLLKLEGMMKTPIGKAMAKQKTERLQEFRGWWDEECLVEDEGTTVLEPKVEG